MTLVDQIIEAALDDKQSVSSLLRKCLVLAHQLKNIELADWAESELDGYFNKEKEELPSYRVVRAAAKGLMVGPFGSSIRDQPIPSIILKKEHRDFAETVWLVQPIASYDTQEEGRDKGRTILEWPPNLTVLYQNKILQGYTLNRAYQEIPESCVVGLLDTVRNRVLKLVLKLKDQPDADEGKMLEAIPKDAVRQFVTNIIYGGQNVIGSTTRDVQQMGDINIAKGDLPALRDFLAQTGVSQEDTKKLEEALEADAHQASEQRQLGARVREWLGTLSGKSLNVSGEIAIGMITAVICKYLGIA